MPRLCKNRLPNLVAMLSGCALLALLAVGCGTTQQRNATQQLLLSEAVDRSVSAIDFRPMAGKKVYLDSQYLRAVKSPDFVNAEYITSALRQQIVAAGCLLMEHNEDAELVIEARVGTLGADGHRMVYGIPASNALASAAEILPNAPPIPAIPEIAIARRDTEEAAAKIAAFAYDRETRQPVWQSGISRSQSTSRDTWVLGAGPFQAGSIRDGMVLPGGQLTIGGDGELVDGVEPRPPVDYERPVAFLDGWPNGPDYPPRPVRGPAAPNAGETRLADGEAGGPAPDEGNGGPPAGEPAANVAAQPDPEQMAR